MKRLVAQGQSAPEHGETLTTLPSRPEAEVTGSGITRVAGDVHRRWRHRQVP